MVKCCAAILTGLCIFAVTSQGLASDSLFVSVDDPLPPFMLQDYENPGRYVALRDYCGVPRDTRPNLERKPVVLSFFAHHCEPCKREIPRIEELAGQWGDSVQVFLIAVGDNRETIGRWKEENPTSLTILLDPYQATSVDRYGIRSLPTVMVLDSAGIIRCIRRGYQEGDETTLTSVVDSIRQETP